LRIPFFFFFFFLFHLPLLLERELKGITINKRVTKYIRAERKVKNGPKAARNGEESTFFLKEINNKTKSPNKNKSRGLQK
jgi:hypothetical protein